MEIGRRAQRAAKGESAGRQRRVGEGRVPAPDVGCDALRELNGAERTEALRGRWLHLWFQASRACLVMFSVFQCVQSVRDSELCAKHTPWLATDRTPAPSAALGCRDRHENPGAGPEQRPDDEQPEEGVAVEAHQPVACAGWQQVYKQHQLGR